MELYDALFVGEKKLIEKKAPQFDLKSIFSPIIFLSTFITNYNLTPRSRATFGYPTYIKTSNEYSTYHKNPNGWPGLCWMSVTFQRVVEF